MTEEAPRPTTATLAVWDLPTRLFHWTLALLIAFSWWSGEEGHIDWHMWSGYGVMTLLLFRLMWGVVGSSTARFANFVRGPSAVMTYVRDIRGWTAIGHSPIGALSVIALLVVIAAMVGTGLIQTNDDGLVSGPLAQLVSYELSDDANDWHQDMVNILLALIGLHVAAILFYRLVLGKRLTKPMLTGRADLDPAIEPMKPGKAWLAVLCLLLAIGVTRWIIGGAPPFGT